LIAFLQPTTAAQDSTVQLSASKAKELGVSNDDVVVLIGRRRHAAYATVSIADKKDKDKTKKNSCSISQNMAANLRLRQDDAVKVGLIETETEAAQSERSGDLLLLQQQPTPIATVTLSPVQDSLQGLAASEGGDVLDDDEIMARFVAPYLESTLSESSSALLKRHHLLTLRDKHNKRLEFYVSHVALEKDGDGDDEEEAAEEEMGTSSSSLLLLL